MPKLVQTLKKNRLTLLVELAQPDYELARVAVASGADGIQLTYADNTKALNEVVKKLTCPVGLNIPAKTKISPTDLKQLLKQGVDYLVFNDPETPAELAVEKVSKVIALDNKYTLEKLMGMDLSGFKALDAAIIPHEGYAKNLVVGDLQNYIAIILSVGVPVIIPTQRLIRTSEVAIISDTGAKGILMTSVVTGNEKKSLAEAVTAFKIEIDNLED